MNPSRQPAQLDDQAEPMRPVAYDANNQPLYAAPNPPETQASPPHISEVSEQASSHVTAAPPLQEGQNYDPRMRVQYGNEPMVVHHPRAYEPNIGEMSDELRFKHEKSTRMYPSLNLSEGEFVVLNIKRHPIGLIIPTFTTVAAITTLLAALIVYPDLAETAAGDIPGIATVTVILLGLIMLVGIGGYIAVWVYLQNTFYLTNESVIQEIQHGVFSKHEQTVSLGSIEDASFKQYGIFQALFNYGTIRLSTEGEETTYRFQYVANPKKQIAIVNNAIESFKNGRPVTGDNTDDDDMN